jgi:dehydrogenase/reductase SDR family protein 7
MMLSVVRNAVAAAGAAFAVAFASTMDANVSLYLYDKLFVFHDDRRLLREHLGGKTLWITGASSGIGAELARQVCRYGVKHLILTGRSVERLQAVADECAAASAVSSDNKGTSEQTRTSTAIPTKLSILPLDMTASEKEFQAAVDALETILGDDDTLDCVILNAGTGQLRPAVKTSSSTTRELFQVNTLAPIAITQILLERGILSRDKRQHLVVTSSIGALMGVPLSASYAGSKWAIQGYMRSLKAEMPWLCIDLVCPGPVDTAFLDHHQPTSEGTSTNESTTTDGDRKKRRLKMSVDRCVRLYLSSLLLGDRTNGGEFWIAEQPTLAGLYINQYFPAMFQTLLTKIGPLRVQAWEEGRDLYDPETWKAMGTSSKKKKQ